MQSTKEYVLVRLDIVYPDSMSREDAVNTVVTECNYEFAFDSGGVKITGTELKANSAEQDGF